MKKLLMFAACLVMTANLVAQETYQIPVINSDQKHGYMISQLWAISAAGINFAKTQGVAPYEYGKYIGKLFAPSWGAGNDFNKLVRGSAYNFETMRHVSDPALSVIQNSDGTVSLVAEENIFHKYFPESNAFASFDEFLEFNKGLFEPIADHMGATVKIERRDAKLIYTFTKK